MTETLHSFNEFSAEELGRRLFQIYQVGETAEIFDRRNIHGFGFRYGQSVDRAVKSVQKGQSATDPEHLVIVGDDGNVYGTASGYADLKLGRTHLPLPGAIARGEKGPAIPGVFTFYPYAGPNIQAAVMDGKEDLLYPAYAELRKRYPTPREFPNSHGKLHKRAWTLEANPLFRKMHRAQQAAHEAIKAAGMQEVTTGMFDDHETGAAFIPRSTLYVAPFRSWRSTRQQLKGIRTGKFTWGEKMDATTEEWASRNPRG